MLRQQLLLLFRNFKRFKGTFFINLIGLSTGLACSLLIYLWVNDELHFDKFHEKNSQLYRVMANHHHTDGVETLPDVPGLLAPALKAEFPEVETAVPTMSGSLNGSEIITISTDTKHIKAPGRFAGAEFFSAFSYDLIAGTKQQVLADKSNIVLSESLAKKLFNTTDAVIGKTLDWEIYGYKDKVVVSGIFKDVPANSSEQFDFVMPFNYFEENLMGKSRVHWGNYYAYAYLVLKKGTDVDAFNAKIKNFIKGKWAQSTLSIFVRPYSERYLHGNYENGVQAGGRIEYVRLFSIIALFILAIACINFMNLSTARSSRKAKEVGVRKTIGASRSALVFQYLTESVAIAVLSMCIAVFIVELFLPQFNFITGKSLILQYNAGFISTILGITLLTGVLAGSYPALYLSGFDPVQVLKGKLKSSVSELFIRKGLVVFQFGISVVLIVGVMVIYKQIEYIQHKNLGFNKNNVISNELERRVSLEKETFLSEVREIPGVERAATTSLLIGKGNWTQGISWEGKAPDADYAFGEVSVSDGLIETLGMELREGRSFSKKYGTDSTGIIFNEAAIQIMGMKDPIGKTVRHYSGEKHIVGVVKDFHSYSLHEKVKPMFMLFRPRESTHLMVRIAAGQEPETLTRLQELYEKINPGYAFQFRFLDEDFQAMYVAEQRVSTLSKYFAGLAILISCLGLFGLAAFSAEQRTKEIGIRKVLGASTAGIVSLLSTDFLLLVILALLLASPLAYFFMEKWLDGFAYHISISWWVFPMVGILAVAVAFLTVGFQSLKAALADPVQSLRSE
ncbi:MAG: ABC transporter permease [Lewinellaceae bacterium]|nr:ABC transporter permease [Saprospiraceae bacterium]MCB9331962.1 ABC transporter permease [Lewinellaceae bacterium]